MSSPLNNPLASLSPDQLAAVFQTMSTFYNLITTPSLASSDTSMHRSHRAATLAAAASTLPKLKEGAYSQWAFAVGDAIRSAGLWDYISGDINCPDDKASKEYDLYLQESGVVRAVIVGSLDPEKSFRYLGGTTTPKEAWDALRVRYHESDDAALRDIDEQLMGLRLEEGGDLVEHIALFKRLKKELDGSDFELHPTRAVQWIWKSLPSSYDQVVLRQQRSKVRDFDAICLELEAHYRSLSSCSSPTDTDDASSTSQPKFGPYWNVPEDLRELPLTGAKNPALAARANNTCRDCLETGHEANTPRCNFYRYRIELWGPNMSNPSRKSPQPVEDRASVIEAEAVPEIGVIETVGLPRPRPLFPMDPTGGMSSSISSSSTISAPLPSPQLYQPTDSSSSPTFYSCPETGLDSNLNSPGPISTSPSIPGSPLILDLPSIPGSSANPTSPAMSPLPPSIPPSPSTLASSPPRVASPPPIYGAQLTRPATPEGLRTAVQDLVGRVHGGEPLNHPPDWQGLPKCFPRTPTSGTSKPPETIDNQTSCVFEEFTPSEPLVFKDPQGTPGGTRMVNGELLSALSLGRYSFAPWGENSREALMESLDASEKACPGGLGLVYEVLFPGGFFNLKEALPFSREIVDLFYAWYHAVRTHNGLKMELKRVCKCGAVTR